MARPTAGTIALLLIIVGLLTPAIYWITSLFGSLNVPKLSSVANVSASNPLRSAVDVIDGLFHFVYRLFTSPYVFVFLLGLGILYWVLGGE